MAAIHSSLQDSKTGIRHLLLTVFLLAIPLHCAAQGLLSGNELVTALRAGGFNLYFRHVATEWSQSDDVRRAGDWRSCDSARMRQLSDAGRADAGAIGDAMRSLAVPVGSVLASPYCRTVETARLIDVGGVEESVAVMNLRSAEYFGGRGGILANARALLASAPEPGTNRVIVAHGNVAREATSVYPQEGEALAFRPDGAGGFDLRARIRPSDWAGLLELAQQ
jgi:phosphohistidine phosphatase SixA